MQYILLFAVIIWAAALCNLPEDKGITYYIPGERNEESVPVKDVEDKTAEVKEQAEGGFSGKAAMPKEEAVRIAKDIAIKYKKALGAI